MFGALGRVVTRHPWRTMVVWLILVIGFGAGAFWGYGHGNLFDRLDNSVSLVKGSESDDVNQVTSPASQGATITVVVTGVDIDTDAGPLVQFMGSHRTNLTMVESVKSEADPFLAGPPTTPQMQALVSDKKDGFVITITLDDNLTEDEENQAYTDVDDAVTKLQTDLVKVFPDASCHILSTHDFNKAVLSQIQDDLVRAETIGLPVALLLLIIIFGGVIAAGLPILSAIISIVIGMGALWAITFSTSVESFILNVVSLVGLALSIDYGLLIVSRYREELKAVRDRGRGRGKAAKRAPHQVVTKEMVQEAVELTVKSAGRTVFFSALTIAMSMMALVVMKAAMLRIIAAGGIIVTILAVLTAITLVPSLIVILNQKLVKPSVVTKVPGLRSIVKAVGDSASDSGFFSRLAHGVHKHPWLIMLGVFVILGIMASPLLHLTPRTVFSDYLPEGRDIAVAYDAVQDNYPALKAASIIIVADAKPEDMADLVQHVSDLDGVDFTAPPAALPDDDSRSYFSVHIDQANQVGPEITQDVKDLRDYDPGYDIEVGGPAALQMDFIDSIIEGAPLALGIVIAAVFILLFLLTGSVVIPIKALIINALSLFASLGTTSFIFMHGWLGMPKVMGFETFIIACVSCFGFGLAMDYEVFLIARIKEYWDAGDDSNASVAHGLQRSGRIITSAAAIIVAVFVGFSTGELVPIKELGVALAITVITDATLVRMLLVPATMNILGKWNWWSPPPLRWLYSKFHLVH